MRKISRRNALVLMSMAAGAHAVRGQQPQVEVYKDPTCGCCGKWADHLRKGGFEVKTTDAADMDAIKTKHGVPKQARSCHTALVGGYVIEGHVPAADVQRLLNERPAGVIGIAV